MYIFLIFDSYSELGPSIPIIKSLKKRNIKPLIIFFDNKILKEIKKSYGLISFINEYSIIISINNIFSYFKFKFTYLKHIFKFNSYKTIKQNFFIEIFANNKSNIFTTEPLKFTPSQLKNLRNCSLYIYPHAFTIKTTKYDKYKNIDINNFYKKLKKKYRKLESLGANVKFLVCSKDEKKYHSKFLPKNIDIKNIGNSRFPILKNLSNKIQFDRKKFRVLLILGKSFYISEKAFNNFLNRFSTFSKKNSIFIDYKLHPRDINKQENLNHFNNTYFNKVDGFLSNILKDYSLVIVNSKTSSIFEVLSLKLPVFMYYIRSNKSENRQFEYKFDNKITSLFSKYGLVDDFSNFDILLKNVIKMSNDKSYKYKILDKQIYNYNKFFDDDNDTTINKLLDI